MSVITRDPTPFIAMQRLEPAAWYPFMAILKSFLPEASAKTWAYPTVATIK